MAKPIELIPTLRDAREELRRRVENAPAEHAVAVLSAFDLLDELHTSGTLDVLRGAVGAGGEIVKQGSALAAKPESIKAMRNLLVVAQLLGSIDPDTLHRVADGLPSAAEQDRNQKPPSLFRIFRRLSSENSRRALAVLTGILDNVGRGLDPRAR